jgi:ubiquinone/menaquinone biosynthesis C-methylase UbiE
VRPVLSSKKGSASYYDRLSRWYDLLAVWSECKRIELGLQMLAVRRGERVLEIGFGTGYALLSIARSVGNDGEVYGIDSSRGMLEVARLRLRKVGLLHRTQLRLGNAVCLSFGDEFFDALFMSFTLELFDANTMPKVLCECYRVLRNDGRLCIVALSNSGCGVVKRTYEWLHDRFPQYIDCRPIMLKEVLEGADFNVVEAAEYSLFGLPVQIAKATKKS